MLLYFTEAPDPSLSTVSCWILPARQFPGSASPPGAG
jgi:hypothetical protein